MTQEGEPKPVTEDGVWSGGGSIAADRGVFGISVAAELAGVPVASLRLFEARGLLDPARTGGGTRRYSADDVGRARHITALQDDGLNLAGIAAVLSLEDRVGALAAENAVLHAEIAQLRQQISDTSEDTTPSGRVAAGSQVRSRRGR